MIKKNINKLKGRVFRVSKRVKSCPGSENYPVYGVTNKEGVIITGKDASFNLENYIVVEGQKFVYNPYRINVGSIGLTTKNFLGIVSPAYVVFEVKDIVPEVLFTFLKSDRGNRLINWYGNHGSVRKALRFSDLEKIDFPVMEREQQLLIAKKFSIAADMINLLKTNNDFDSKHIQKLRQAILSEAIQGKLIPQDPNDEPAIVLLEKIKSEKQELIKEKKIKKEKPLPPIAKDEIPFELPKLWVWVRFGDLLAQLLGGYAYKSHSYVAESENQLIRLGNVKNDMLLLDSNPVFISDVVADSTREFQLKENDILITMTGTKSKRDYGFTLILQKDNVSGRKLFLNQRVGCMRFGKHIQSDLVNMFLKSGYVIGSILSTETGTANQGNIGSAALKCMLFPLPPENEQKRIVQKVAELMRLCDELEKQVADNQLNSERLMDAILREAFAHEA